MSCYSTLNPATPFLKSNNCKNYMLIIYGHFPIRSEQYNWKKWRREWGLFKHLKTSNGHVFISSVDELAAEVNSLHIHLPVHTKCLLYRSTERTTRRRPAPASASANELADLRHHHFHHISCIIHQQWPQEHSPKPHQCHHYFCSQTQHWSIETIFFPSPAYNLAFNIWGVTVVLSLSLSILSLEVGGQL